MRFRLALALVLSMVLVAGATWFRFTSADSKPSGLVAVNDATSNEYYQELLDGYKNTNPLNTERGEQEPLSDTDIISRQFLTDYVKLATNGQASDENLTALADRYVDSIPTLNKATVLTYGDLQTISNTKENLSAYATSITHIYNDYASKVKAAKGNSKEFDLNPALYSMTDKLSKIYTDTAAALQNVGVPAVMAQVHLRLVNNYLSNAAALESISQTEQNSAAAFAGLVILSSNLDTEDAILDELTQLLTKNGV